MKVMYNVNQMEAAIEYVLTHNKYAKEYGWTRQSIRDYIFKCFKGVIKSRENFWASCMGITVYFGGNSEDSVYADITVDPNLCGKSTWSYYYGVS